MSASRFRIVVDTFERDGGVAQALAELGVDVSFRRLDVADYDLGRGILVERKTVPDLHLSLQRGRLWRQIGELRNTARLPYLLVEGASLDDRTISPEAVRGALLAVVAQGVPLLRTHDFADSARWLRLLALRTGGFRLPRDRPTYAQRLKPPGELVKEAMLAVVPGISVASARALLARFGSVSEVCSAGYEAWLTVPGIGPARAQALRKALS